MPKPEPEIRGTAGGLTARPQVRPVNDDVEREVERPEVGAAIPANCLRVLHSPLSAELGGGCSSDCPGYQRDDSCLCAIVQSEWAAGRELRDLRFEIDEEGYWNLVEGGDA